MLADIAEERGTAVAERIGKVGGRTRSVAADIADEEEGRARIVAAAHAPGPWTSWSPTPTPSMSAPPTGCRRQDWAFPATPPTPPPGAPCSPCAANWPSNTVPRPASHAVVPGPILTAAWDSVSEADRERSVLTAAHRFGTPEEQAAAIAFLAADEASWSADRASA